MRELSERYQQHAASQPAPAPGEVAALVNKLESFVDAPVAPSLPGFGAFVAAVEEATGAQFVRKVAYSYFSKGIKNKAAVSQWLVAGAH